MSSKLSLQNCHEGEPVMEEMRALDVLEELFVERSRR